MDTKDKVIEVLKTAILIERRGKAFYAQAARQSKSEATRQIFEMMAEEEEAHISFLEEQFRNYVANHEFTSGYSVPEEDDSEVERLIGQVKNEIDAAGYEAAAISAAIDFENRAIELYSKRAEEATDEKEKAAYKMLADWEKTHHHLLYRLNEDLKERIWNDNNFWPF